MFRLLDIIQISPAIKRFAVLIIYLLVISTKDTAIQSCEQFLMYIRLLLRGENMPLIFI